MSRVDNCRSCGALIIWARSPKTGKANPLDLEPLDVVGVGVVAVNPRTGNGHALTAEDVADRELQRQWADRGVTFHRSHFITCPNAKAHKGQPRNQEGAA